jgi:hypothetical protein
MILINNFVYMSKIPTPEGPAIDLLPPEGD